MLTRLLSLCARQLGIPPRASVRLVCGSVRTVEGFLRPHPLPPHLREGSVSIDLGCGVCPRNPYQASRVVGLDRCFSDASNLIDHGEEMSFVHADLFSSLIPFAEASASVVTAFDFIEHVPRVDLSRGVRYPFVDLMSDVHRVLIPGGYFFSKTPAYPFAQAFQDPTHVNIITENTFPYFCAADGFHPQASIYGFRGRFKLLDQKWWGRAWLLTLLQAC